jgi:hypothetical protein
VYVRRFVPGAFILALVSFLCVSSVRAQQDPGKPPSSDLDAFMEKVLARREVVRKVMNDYILDERETFEILGPGGYRLHRTNREYTWFVREGIHVRSPLRYEGVAIPEESRVEYEERWLRREKERLARKADREKAKQKGEPVEPESKQITISPSEISTNALPTEPRFVSEAYFMDFKFEPGNYLLAGREQLDGTEVLRIEYYPTRLFGGKDDEKTPREIKREKERSDRERQIEQDINRKMNKTALVTLWVDPKEHQIVKYTFENVWLDFLPGAWLVRVDDIRASMTMFQPFPGVWLPRGIDISGGATLASGSFTAAYERRFAEYRQADVKSKITVPKRVPDPDPVSLAPEENEPGFRGPFVPATEETTELTLKGVRHLKVPDPLSAVQAEIVREIRVHGNAAVPDAEVLRIAGIAIGTPVDVDLERTVAQRLEDSGRFETVDVRKRYRSLTDPTDVAIVLLVHEKAGVIATPDGRIERPMSRQISSRIMFLPILGYSDGYGFTYGARFSTVDLLGFGERLSVPLTWGGTRRVALELERTFEHGPFTRVLSSAALWQRENPGFVFEDGDDDSTSDRRIELKGRVERNVAQIFFTGLEATRARVEFGPFPAATQWTIGADAALDTRGDPAFPANAIYVGGGWNRLNFEDLETNRYTVDARGYLRLIRQPVLAGRIQYFTADGPLPPHERWLIGGSSTLRGVRAGALNGTKALITSAELRVPITSVISGGKFGVIAFMDAAKVGDEEFRLQDARWSKSAGGGVFLIASVIRLNLDIAREIREGGRTRVHLSSGFVF